MKVILIRHGETDYNAKNRYCGISNPPLNKRGIAQAKKLAKRLKDLKVDKVYSSDMRRTLETAKIVFPQHEIKQQEALRELDFGVFEGLTYDEIMMQYPEVYRSWLENLEEFRIPQGERLDELDKRVHDALGNLISESQAKCLVLVSHSGPIKTLLCRALGYSLDRFWQIEQETTAVNIIEYCLSQEPQVAIHNDVSHLNL